VAGVLVPVGDDQERRDILEAAAEEPQQVHGGLVGPVHILDDDDVQAGRLAESA